MSSEGRWETYDDFGSPELTEARWSAREVEFEGDRFSLNDASARVLIDDHVRIVHIDTFTRQHASVQNFDNPKSLVMSTATFRLPEAGVSRFAAEMRATPIGTDGRDYRDGFLTFNVVDVDDRYVVDAITTGARAFALYELQPKPIGVVEQHESFLYVTESAIDGPAVEPNTWHDYVVSLSMDDRSIDVSVDGLSIFATEMRGPTPRRIKLGMGILTLHPLASGRGSCRGQGMHGEWRNIRAENATQSQA